MHDIKSKKQDKNFFKLWTDFTEIALGQRPPSLAKCFLGELIHRPTGKWSFLKRGLPDPSI